LKLPGEGIAAELTVAVTSEMFFTVVARMAPLKIITEEETNWLPLAVSTKLGGNCENIMVVGEIELRIGVGRALPQSGFSALHPGRTNSTTSSNPRVSIR
jgi:hypothetical protein